MSRTSEFPSYSQTETLRGTAPAVGAAAADAARAHQDVLRGLDGKQACPFCGAVGEKSSAPCPRCGMDNTPDARKATKARIGPWYVLQARNPAAPGMRFETLLTFVQKGRVRARSVVRGPTTHQLWRFAAHVKGLSREFGLCFSCGSSIETTANICPQCNRLQEPPINPDVLLEANPVEDSPRAAAVLRELPDPPAPSEYAPPTAALPALVPASSPAVPEEIDIVIPALGGFGPDDLDAQAPARAAAAVPAPIASAPAPTAPAPALAPDPMPSVGAIEPTRHAGAVFGAPIAPPTAAPLAAAENPFAMSPPPRRKPNGEASFLSAKDLAAAFQLSFDPSAEMDRVDVPDRVPAGAMPDGMHPSAMMPRNPLGPHPQTPRRGGFRKFVLFVFILLATGLGVLMWVDPNFRSKAVDWSKGMYAKLRGGVRNAPAPAGAPTDSGFDVPMPATSPASTASDLATAGEGAPAALESDEASPPRSRPEPEATSASESAPEEGLEIDVRPAAADPDRPAAKRDRPRGQPGEAGTVDGGEAPEFEPVAETPSSPDAADDGLGADRDRREPEPQADDDLKMRVLRRKAVTAEGNGDFETAVRAYEEIQTLPESVWPGDLQLRLNEARKREREQRD